MARYGYKTVPIYLFRIPYRYSYECDECGTKHYYWGTRPFFKIGEKRVPKTRDDVLNESLATFYDKKLLERLEPSLLFEKLSGMETEAKGKATIKFRRYGDLTEGVNPDGKQNEQGE